MYCSNCGNKISPNDKFCPACGKAIDIESDSGSTNILDDNNSNTFIPPVLELFRDAPDDDAAALDSGENEEYDTNIDFKHYYRSATLRALISAILILLFAVGGIYLIVTQTNTVEYIQSIFTKGTESGADKSASLKIKSITSDAIRSDAKGKNINYDPKNLLVDTNNKGDQATCWAYKYSTHQNGATLTVELEHKSIVHGIKIRNGYTKSEETYNKNRKVKTLCVEYGDGLTETFALKDEEDYCKSQVEIFKLARPAETEVIIIHITEVTDKPKETIDQDDVCLSYLSVF